MTYETFPAPFYTDYQVPLFNMGFFRFCGVHGCTSYVYGLVSNLCKGQISGEYFLFDVIMFCSQINGNTQIKSE